MAPTKKKGNSNQIRLRDLTPLTPNQSAFFYEYENYKVHSLTGYPGTGKSFIALYKALEELEIDDTLYKLIIIRSSVPTRDIGYLPGNLNEKMSAYETPYIDIVNQIYGRGDAWEIQKNKRIIEFHSSSFMRGRTLDNCIVVIDEAQNMEKGELFTLLTRIGNNCRVIICGDVNQDDLTSDRFKIKSGYSEMLGILKKMRSVNHITFDVDDIVRSGWVKELIIAYMDVDKKPLPEMGGSLRLIS